MNLLTLRKRVAQHLTNRKGWSTNRKIVVIESDDWGSVRMPSKEVYNRMGEIDVPVHNSPYCKYDSLASEKDLEVLFEVLYKYRDSSNNHPAITANCIVSNPDFEKIQRAKFTEYYSESIEETFKKYPEHGRCLDLWRLGNREGFFHPQFHGREHLNITYWLELLRNKDFDFTTAFDNGFWGLSNDIYPELKRSVQASFDAVTPGEISLHQQVIREGLQAFENIFGYRSESFIANNYIWSSKLNETLYEEGVNFLQGMKFQKLPIMSDRKRKKIRHYVGEKNVLGQYYLVRNASFEPSISENQYDHVAECLKGISTAFFWNRPAIICSHRVNYVGFLDPSNRIKNLALLDELIGKIIKNWPDVEFLTSDQLGRYIREDVEHIKTYSKIDHKDEPAGISARA